MQITPGVVTLFAPSSFNLGSISFSYADQNLTGQFTEYFIVDDGKWSNSGYFTTITSSALQQSGGSATIPATNVALKIANVTGTNGTIGVDLLSGTVNSHVSIPLGLINYQSLDDVGVTYLRKVAAESNWILGKYGNKPYLQVTVPAYQAIGLYTGTLTYTLYENL